MVTSNKQIGDSVQGHFLALNEDVTKTGKPTSADLSHNTKAVEPCNHLNKLLRRLKEEKASVNLYNMESQLYVKWKLEFNTRAKQLIKFLQRNQCEIPLVSD